MEEAAASEGLKVEGPKVGEAPVIDARLSPKPESGHETTLGQPYCGQQDHQLFAGLAAKR